MYIDVPDYASDYVPKTKICPICLSENRYQFTRNIPDNGSGIKNTKTLKDMVGFFEAMLETAEVSE